MATRPKFAKMANYSGECVECESHFSEMTFGECERMYRVRAKQGGKFSEFLSQVVLYTKKEIFLCIKRSSLPSPNLPNSPNSLNTRQIRRSESQKFAQYSPNSPERVTKIWRIFGEYSNSLNSPASGHCLIKQPIESSYGMYLYDSGPSSEYSFEVVHGVAQGFPVVLGLVVVHLGNVFVGLASYGDGIGQVGAFCVKIIINFVLQAQFIFPKIKESQEKKRKRLNLG